MVRRYLSALVVVLLATGLTGAASLDEILGKANEARGGLKNLKAVESARVSGKYVVVGMMEAPITIEWKRPNKIRMDFSTPQGDGVQAFDGETAWAVMPGAGGPQELPEEQAASIRRQADFLEGPLVDWQAKGHSVEYLGEGELEGAAVHKVKLTQAEGTEVTIFLDAGNFLPIRQSGTAKMQGMETDVETYISDYKKVGELTMAHHVKSELIDVGLTQTLMMETIELNAELADDRFAMPAAPESPEEAEAPGGE